MTLTGRKGQQISEYGIMLGTAILAAVVMQHRVTAAIAGGLQGATAQMLGTTYPANDGGNNTTSHNTLTQVGNSGKVKITSTSDSSASSSSGFLIAKPYGPYLGVFVTYKDMVGNPSPSYDSINLQLPELREGSVARSLFSRFHGKRFRVLSDKLNRGKGRLEVLIDTGSGQQMVLGVTDEWVEWNSTIDALVGAGYAAANLNLDGAWPSPPPETLEGMTPTGTTLPPNLRPSAKDHQAAEAQQKKYHDRVVTARRDGQQAVKDLLNLLFGEHVNAEELRKAAGSWSPDGVSKRFESKTLKELRDLRKRAKADIEQITEAGKIAGVDPALLSNLPGGDSSQQGVGGGAFVRQPSLTQQDYERWNSRTPPSDVSKALGGELWDLDGDGLPDLASAGPNKFRPIRWLVVAPQTQEDVQRGIAKEQANQQAVDAYLHAGSLPDFSPAGDLKAQEKAQYLSSSFEVRQRLQHDRLPNAKVKKFEIPTFHDDGLTVEESQAAGRSPRAWLENPPPMKIVDDQGKVVGGSTPDGSVVTPRVWIRLNPEAVPPDATPLFQTGNNGQTSAGASSGISSDQISTPERPLSFGSPASASHPGTKVPGN